MRIKRKFLNRIISFLTVFTLIIPTAVQLNVSAEEAEKYPYTMFGRNGIIMTATSNMCINGVIHTNKEAEITATNKNINGKLTTGNDIEKRVKHVYADTKIYENYFTENCDLYEEEYVYSELNIHINNPLFCYNNITLNGNVSLNSNLGTLMNLNVTGEVKNANTSVVYSKYGDITIENESTANINGLIYAPLGTVTINSPNVTINGVIIADKVVINSSNVNINCNDNVAGFIGITSELYDFSGLEYLPEEWLNDTDEDELFDIYEKVIDTDPFDTDTDDDKLPDGYEVLTLNTDPLEVDTDENGIFDADEDFDTDNLNNLGEYQNGTQPYNPDTDEDGFLDGDEVFNYGTEPLNPDTDGDGLLDGEEGYDGTTYLKNGVYFEPLNPDTDGDSILDGDEVFGQKKQQTVETHDEAITEIIVDMDTNGNLEKNLTIESMYNVDAMSTDVYALIGEPFNFETPTSFNSATITFKIDKSKLGDTQFDNLLILWYNEEEQIFEEMETIHDEANSTVSTTTTHFSQYMIVDSEKWFANWEQSFTEIRKMWSGGTTYYKSMNTIFVIDCCSDMARIDNENGVSRLNICTNIVNNMMSWDCAAVVTYSEYGTKGVCGLTDKNSALSILSSYIHSSGAKSYLTPAFETALGIANSNSADMNRIVILTNGNTTFTRDFSGYNLSNVTVNVVDLGGFTTGESLKDIAGITNGSVYSIATANSLAYQYGESVYTPPQFIGEDTDGDTIPDIVELYGLKPNGAPINSNPNLKDTDGDGLDDNVEINFSLGNITYDINEKEDYDNSIYVWSDPNNSDSDGDGILDDEDESPLFNVTKEELELKVFLENAEYFEIAFLFGGENEENIGFVHTYENIYDRIKIIEIFRKHIYTNDYVSYYKDMVLAGYISEMPEKNWFGNYKHNDVADLMLYSYELASEGTSFAELSDIAYQDWSSNMKAFASIWLFGVSDSYCKELAKWDYLHEYKISLEQERTICDFQKYVTNEEYDHNLISDNSAHNAATFEKLKKSYDVQVKGYDVIDSLKNTGKLPKEYITKSQARSLGWDNGKSLANYAPGKKLGGDIFENKDSLLPISSNRTWYEADVGINYSLKRSNPNNPGYRILFSNDGLIYGTFDHYKTMFYIGTY